MECCLIEENLINDLSFQFYDEISNELYTYLSPKWYLTRSGEAKMVDFKTTMISLQNSIHSNPNPFPNKFVGGINEMIYFVPTKTLSKIVDAVGIGSMSFYNTCRIMTPLCRTHDVSKGDPSLEGSKFKIQTLPHRNSKCDSSSMLFLFLLREKKLKINCIIHLERKDGSARHYLSEISNGTTIRLKNFEKVIDLEMVVADVDSMARNSPIICQFIKLTR